MTHETAKATRRRQKDPFYNDVFVGHILDIGAGNDPLAESSFPKITKVTPWDIQNGDAQYLDKLPDSFFDTVYSSHCLEHMVSPEIAVKNWLRVLKINGMILVSVPDEQMYESVYGNLIWPSRHNTDHKWTFRDDRKKTHQKSLCLSDLFLSAEILRLQRITEHYDPLRADDQTLGLAECAIEIVAKKVR